MAKHMLIIGFLMMFNTAPVFAAECPSHLKYIDDNMMKNSISSSQMKVAMAIRLNAVKFHNGSEHEASIIALRTVVRLLELDPL